MNPDQRREPENPIALRKGWGLFGECGEQTPQSKLWNMIDSYPAEGIIILNLQVLKKTGQRT